MSDETAKLAVETATLITIIGHDGVHDAGRAVFQSLEKMHKRLLALESRLASGGQASADKGRADDLQRELTKMSALAESRLSAIRGVYRALGPGYSLMATLGDDVAKVVAERDAAMKRATDAEKVRDALRSELVGVQSALGWSTSYISGTADAVKEFAKLLEGVEPMRKRAEAAEAALKADRANHVTALASMAQRHIDADRLLSLEQRKCEELQASLARIQSWE